MSEAGVTRSRSCRNRLFADMQPSELRESMDPRGGFYDEGDASSDRGEGPNFYVIVGGRRLSTSTGEKAQARRRLLRPARSCSGTPGRDVVGQRPSGVAY